MSRLSALTLILFSLLPFAGNAKSYKTISSADGLSNSAIRCIYQNTLGHIYMGTSDGLNIWDGHSVQIFHAKDGKDYFSGNLIKYLIPYKDNILYLHTRYGIARLNMETDEIQFFQNLAFIYRLAVTDDETLICMDRKNRLYTFNLNSGALSDIKNGSLSEKDYCRRMIITKDGQLCVFCDNETYLISLEPDIEGKLSVSQIKTLGIKCKFVTPEQRHGDRFRYIITTDNKLLEFDSGDLATRQVAHISNLPDDQTKGIIPSEGGYYISFAQEGMFYLPDGGENIRQTDITCGVLSLASDRKQPIVWIGTDCNGLIRYNLNRKNVTCLTYDRMPHSIKMPTRCILIDKERTLWFGTKGDGLYRIPDFAIKEKGTQLQNIQKITTQNSRLCHNSVFSIIESAHGMLWIGTQGDGLNTWSYKKRRIMKVPGSDGLKKIHAIIEQGTTLWVATDNNCAYKCSFVMKDDLPVITSIEQVKLCEPFSEKTSLYSMTLQNDSTIWFGSRGEGVLAYNINSGQSNVMKFPTAKGLATNDTFYMTTSGRMLLFATGNGLISFSTDDNTVRQSEHVPAKATHGIVCDRDKNIFVSTNSGIVSLDSLYNYRMSFDRFSGFEILEYSTGACFYDEMSNRSFFGGINGITIIDNNIETPSDSLFRPEINITKLIQNDSHIHIESRMSKGVLKLPYSKTNFGIKFSVVDNLHYSDYEFKYYIEGHSTDWITNNGDIIYMPTLDPGKYILNIAYTNKSTGYKSESCILPIVINPPFYRTWWAYVLYLAALGHIVSYAIRKNRQKYAAVQEKIKKKYSDEIRKITSKTTNSINEELSVQITFIMGLCQQIHQALSNNSYVADKVNLVEYNVAKINKTLHIFNESNNISEILINAKESEIIAVSQTITEIVELMKSKKTIGNVTLTHHIEKGISLALNKEAFLTMLYALFYKALSSTSGKNQVEIIVKKGVKNEVYIAVRMTADKEIYEKMVSAIAQNDTLSEEDYEMVFCHQLISLMNGKMDIGFDQINEIINIQISLTSVKMETSRNDSEMISDTENIYTYNTFINNQLPKDFKGKAHLDYIYIKSSNRDISSFLGYFLSDSYNILTYTDDETLIQSMERKCPTAVIYDVYSTSEGISGFLDRIKGNAWFEQVITIALTSSLQTRERDECTELGVDLCLSFPFNMDYLISMLDKRIQKKKSTANYYKSAMSDYTIDDGKLISQEDKEFLGMILKAIDQNISNPTLSASLIAENICMSTRVMYRRLEKITDKKLQHIIQEIRINLAQSLIQSSNMTMDEIMFKVGYESRATFYRNFKEIHGVTPGEFRKKRREETTKNLARP